MERSLGEHQQRFRTVRSTVDVIHILNQIEKRIYDNSLDPLFINFKQAFDLIDRARTWKI